MQICVHLSWTCSFRKMSAVSSGRSGKGQLLKQCEQICNPGLLHLESFTSTEYLWYSHWQVWNLSLSLYWYLSQGQEIEMIFRENRIEMVLNSETKNRPKKLKGKKKKRKHVYVTEEIPGKGSESKLGTNREVSTPCNLQGRTKTQPDSKLEGTGRDFPHLEADWRWTDYDICT